MKYQRRSFKLLALLFTFALVAAACGDDGGTAEDTGTDDPSAVTDGTDGGETKETKMVVTYEINPDAVWDDASPITVADFKCTWEAFLNTPASINIVGNDKIISVEEGADDKEVVVNFSEVYAPYKNLFNTIIQASKASDCMDISADFASELPMSGRPFKLDSWGPDQAILVPNENYWGDNKAKAERVVMVPQSSSDTELASLKAGEVDFIFPQGFAGLADGLSDPNIKFTPGYGLQYEGLYFEQSKPEGPFHDADFRKAFAQSIDRDLILQTIYAPIFPGGKLLNCGLWVPTIGNWCDNTQYEGSYDPTGAEKILTDAGWAKNGEGFWAKDGKAPEIRWIVNTGNKRREDTQALMIPNLKDAGFNVKADNCDAACYFQQRLPGHDYDLAMYINVASPDPTVSSIMHCDQIPSPENNNQGQNNTGWCNEEASELMDASDKELDTAKREDQIHRIGELLAEDKAMLPLYQFPNVAAWRTDKLEGPIDADAANFRAFANNLWEWVPKGKSDIIIGAEQWPDCLNPTTECNNSSWAVWTTAFQLLPAAFDTTPDGEYVITELLAGEPKVEVK